MISERLDTRELITLEGGGVLVRGTYHKPAGGVVSHGKDSKTIGILFINPLSTPRTLIGDSAVYWANSFAASGYPAFRLDLPGLGDSYGVLPADLVAFINDGGYAQITASKVTELTQRFNLSGVVVYGHCAGGTTAIWVASECNECKGLVVTDPYFNVANRLTPKLSPEVVDWARRSKIGEMLRAIYSRMRESPKGLRNGALPSNANFALIARWKKVLSKDLPVLVLTAPHPETAASSKLRSGSFDYLAYLAEYAVRRNQMNAMALEDTDHSFANQTGRTAVEQEVAAWLGENFPLNRTSPAFSRCEQVQSMDTNTVTLGVPVPAYVSSGE